MESVILIADDDPRILNVVKLYLEAEDYQVIDVESGENALEIIDNRDVDLVLLDLMLPGIDGWTICKHIRKNSKLPVIMLTAKGEENDRILGLELGADDYIVKPFSPRELVARVKAVLRRTEDLGGKKNVYSFPGITLDALTRQVKINHHDIKLTMKEFELLYLFIKSPDKVYTREHLLEQVWGFDYCGDSRTVDTHINRLRSKIEEYGFDGNIIKTVRGVGYKFSKDGL
ncbi:MAG: response regulator transcription factor [Firmicutes bacterium]|nr:response regulator transcription factor [Bacillota bacterium]